MVNEERLVHPAHRVQRIEGDKAARGDEEGDFQEVRVQFFRGSTLRAPAAILIDQLVTAGAVLSRKRTDSGHMPPSHTT